MISTFLDSLDSWIGVVRAGVHTLGHPILYVSGIRRILYTCTYFSYLLLVGYITCARVRPIAV